jgi:hypothetical protein
VAELCDAVARATAADGVTASSWLKGLGLQVHPSTLAKISKALHVCDEGRRGEPVGLVAAVGEAWDTRREWGSVEETPVGIDMPTCVNDSNQRDYLNLAAQFCYFASNTGTLYTHASRLGLTIATDAVGGLGLRGKRTKLKRRCGVHG